MKRFEGKRLLELGTTMGSVQMVQYAKDNGAYVIVADIDKPERSAAKRIADKTYMCDLKDVEGLIKIARKEKIDGVVTGASEAILQSCRKIAEELGSLSILQKNCGTDLCEKTVFVNCVASMESQLQRPIMLERLRISVT